jgi:hypothetical protein
LKDLVIDTAVNVVTSGTPYVFKNLKNIFRKSDDVIDVADDVASAGKKVDNIAEGTIKTIPDIIPNKGFSKFDDLKKYLGSPGQDNAWHHFVEQSQIGKRANFTSSQVNNVNNIIAIPHGNGSIHSKISAHYSSKFDFTDGKIVRDWLATQSFDEQFKYGKELLEEFGTVTATKNGWVFKKH